MNMHEGLIIYSNYYKDIIIRIKNLHLYLGTDFFNKYVPIRLFAYRNYSNKRRGVKKNFGISDAAFIQGRRLFEGGVYCKILISNPKNEQYNSYVS